MLKREKMFRLIRILLLPGLLVLCIYVTQLSLTALIDANGPFMARYLSLRGNTEELKRSSLLIDIADNVKAMVPEDACIEVSRVPLTVLLSFRYYVYPLKFVIPEVNDFNSQARICNGRYFVDLSAEIKTPSKNWHAFPLPGGAVLYGIGDSPAPSAHIVPRVPASSLGAYILFVCIEVLAGMFILYGFIPNADEWPLSGKLGGAFMFGFVGLTLPFWVLSLLRVHLTEFLVYTVIAMLLLLYYLFMNIRKKGRSVTYNWQGLDLTGMTFNVLGLGLLAFYFFMVIACPVGIVDEVHIWLLKAKMFFDLRILNFDYTEMITNYYPVFWPLNLTLQFIFTVGDHDQIAKWTSAFIFLSSMGLLKAIAMFLGLGRKMSWLVVFLFLIFFHHWTFFTALPENIFIALTMLSLACFIYWLQRQSRGALYATTFALIGLCGSKFEGTVVIGIFFIAFVLSQKFKLADLWPRVRSVWPLSLAFIIHPFWLLWLDWQGVHYSVFHLRREVTPENLISIMQMTVLYLADARITCMLICIAVIVPILWRNVRPWSQAERFILFLVAGLILFAYSAGLCWTNSDFWGFYPEVWMRLTSRAMPFAVVLWMSRVLGHEGRVQHLEARSESSVLC